VLAPAGIERLQIFRKPESTGRRIKINAAKLHQEQQISMREKVTPAKRLRFSISESQIDKVAAHIEAEESPP